MSKLVVLLAALAACQNDTRPLEKRLDGIEAKLEQLLKVVAPRPSQPARPSGPDRNKVYSVPIDGDPFEGPAGAKVTIVKAYDYACPYCEKVRDTMDALRAKYGNDLRIVYKQLVVHPQVATTGALAFCAAGKQGKAFELDHLLWEKGFKARQFDKDRCWESADGCPIVGGFARELGLDEARFAQDMKACTGQIQKDMADMQALGVTATPAFFINGRFLSGAAPIESFSALIDEELKK